MHEAERSHENSFQGDENHPINSNQTQQAHITVNARCVTRTLMQKVKGQGQGHTRLKIDLEAWRRHHSRPLWVNKLFSFPL